MKVLLKKAPDHCFIDAPKFGWGALRFSKNIKMTGQYPFSYVEDVLWQFENLAERFLKDGIAAETFDAEGDDWILTLSNHGVIINFFDKNGKIASKYYEFGFEPNRFLNELFLSILNNMESWYYFSNCEFDFGSIEEYKAHMPVWVQKETETINKILKLINE